MLPLIKKRIKLVLKFSADLLKSFGRKSKSLLMLIMRKSKPAYHKCLQLSVAFLSKIEDLMHKFWQKAKPEINKCLHWIAAFFETTRDSVNNRFLQTPRMKLIKDKLFGSGFKRRFAGAGAIAVVFCMAIVVTNFYNVQYALAVEKDGEVVAYIKDEQTYQQAQNLIAEQIIDIPKEQAEINSVSEHQTSHELKPTNVPDNMDLEDETQLAETLLDNSGHNVVTATGLFVDDVFYGATDNAEALTQTLDQMKENYAVQQGVSVDAVSVKNNVEFKEGLYLADCIQDGSAIASLMQSEIQTEQTYTVQEGDTLISIAAKTGVDYDLLISLNPGLDEFAIQIGQQLILSQSKPLISLSAVKQVEYDQEVPYSQERRENSKLEKGTTNVLQNGENGLVHVCAQVEIVDGQQASSNVISQSTLKDSVPEIVEVGTKESGELIRPLNSGYVSQGYSSSHKAVDIAASTGTPVHAAAGGTVTYASWYSTYGNCVIIDHGNGMQTLYAHLSEIDVRVGQKVSQGNTIGLVGSTGNSTGPHLHFEVRVGGQKVNPYSYCKF